MTFLLTIFPSASVEALLVCLSGRTTTPEVDPSLFTYCDKFSHPGEEQIKVIVRAANERSASVSSYEVDGVDLNRGELQQKIFNAARSVDPEKESITIIGYSWGGFDAARLQRTLAQDEGIRTNLLITIDPVNFGRGIGQFIEVEEELVDLAINIKQSADTRPGVKGLTLLGDDGKKIINIDITEEIRNDVPEGEPKHDQMDNAAAAAAVFDDAKFPNAAPVIRDSVAAAIQQALPNLFQCGNNVREFGEECDDGDNIDGDGCSSTCQAEPQLNLSGTWTICVTRWTSGTPHTSTACDLCPPAPCRTEEIPLNQTPWCFSGPFSVQQTGNELSHQRTGPCWFGSNFTCEDQLAGTILGTRLSAKFTRQITYSPNEVESQVHALSGDIAPSGVTGTDAFTLSFTQQKQCSTVNIDGTATGEMGITIRK